MKNSNKKVLVINGHPDKGSYNFALSDAYVNGLKDSGLEFDILNIRDLDFNPNLQYGYRLISELEPDLQKAIEMIKAADHLVWILPMWWYGYPALTKGFVDRIFLPGLFFKYQKGNAFPKKLLKGKTGRLIITADTVQWYDRWFMKRPLINQFKKGTLQFVGINPVRITYFAPLKSSTLETRKKWLQKVFKLGKAAA